MNSDTEHKNKEVMGNPYKSLIGTQLEYCVQSWEPCIEGCKVFGEGSKEIYRDEGTQLFEKTRLICVVILGPDKR